MTNLGEVVIDDRNVDAGNRQAVISRIGAGRRVRDRAGVIAFAKAIVDRVDDNGLRRERVGGREG